jgi:hypothetical protein
MQKIIKIPKISFNGQTHIFLARLLLAHVIYALKLDILNPLNIFLLSNGLKNESFAL